MEQKEQLKGFTETFCKANGVQLTMCFESGSRAWGFNGATSDYDIKGISVFPAAHYLRIEGETLATQAIQLKSPDNPPAEMLTWDITQALKMVRESNPSILEWLGLNMTATHRQHVYSMDEEFYGRISRLAEQHLCLASLAKHYMSTARKHEKLYFIGKTTVQPKKYFYMLRPLLCVLWIDTHMVNKPKSDEKQALAVPLAPPVVFAELVDSLPEEVGKCAEMRRLVEILEDHSKTGSGAEDSAPERLLDTWAKKLFDRAEAICKKLVTAKGLQQLPPAEEFNRLCADTILAAKWK